MSNWNQYRELWQQKRDELHIDSNAQADWSEMQNILDQQMPVAQPESTKPNTSTPKSPFTGFGPLSIISGLVVAGLVAYFALHTKPVNSVNKNKKTNHTEININRTTADSNSSSNTAEIKSASSNNNRPTQPDNAATGDSNPVSSSPGSNKGGSNSIATANNAAGKNGKNTPSANNSGLNSVSSSGIATANNTSGNKNSASNKLSTSKNLTHNLTGGSQVANNSSVSNYSVANNNTGQHADSRGLNRQQNNSGWVNDKQEFSRQHNIANQSTSGDYSLTGVSGFESVASLQLKWKDIVTGNVYTGQLPYPSVSITRSFADKNSSTKKSSTEKKPAKIKTAKAYGNSADIDWGILVGANTNGSFTTKDFNHNLYGSLGTDPYLGLFATGNINDHWSTGVQIKALVPHLIKGSYTHKNESKVDTGQVFQFQDLRKVYTVDIPIQAIYHVTPNFSLKGGPVVSIPVKQTGGVSGFEKGPERDNSGYYTQVDKALEATDFSKKIQVGLSGGVGLSYQSLSLDATYNYQLQSQKVSSSLGGYSSRMNGLQITLGIQLNKKKKQ